MIRYRIDVLAYLRKCGYTQTRLQREKILGNSTLTKLRSGDVEISMKSLNTICNLTELSIEDILEYIPD